MVNYLISNTLNKYYEFYFKLININNKQMFFLALYLEIQTFQSKRKCLI